MLAKVYSGATVGLSGVLVEVEVDISARSLPSFVIVGLPGKAVEESKERVRAAIQNLQADFPRHRIIVNLSPADLPKEGPSYDLPIALGILLASGLLRTTLGDALFVGELSLDGVLRPAKGCLSMALMAREHKIKRLFVPQANSREASMVSGLQVYGVHTLKELWDHLSGVKPIAPIKTKPFGNVTKKQIFEFDMSEIVGQQSAKRALEIAAAGNHNIFMSGPPGAGKTLLARCLPSILPKMSKDEVLEVTKIYSITGQIVDKNGLVSFRPFRSPHHTVSRIGLIGGGTKPQPGEISLAHRGVLFLDEFPEFPRNVLESLRQPLEDGIVHIVRASGSMDFPARFLLVAAANPCPCGYYGSQKKICRCSGGQIARYHQKISGPIMDRIDLHVSVPEVKIERLINATKNNTSFSEKSILLQKRVQAARQIQLVRFNKLKVRLFSNGEMSNKMVKKWCNLDIPCLKILHKAVSRLNLSARSYYKVIKVARTIADLESSSQITPNHIAEALQYRLQNTD